MGLLNKLKNVLFEEEEIEVPVEEPKRKPKIEPSSKPEKKQVKMTFESEEEPQTPVVSDRELFKAEKTFDFPVFDDQEFESMKHIPAKEEPTKSMSINLFDHERPKIRKESPKQEVRTPEIKGRAYQKESRQNIPAQKFKPSPVISPVYGVLDKNYKKEDIVVEKEEKKSIDVDDVRKKAFGTLEEDIEKTLSKPIDEFYEENLELEEPIEPLENKEEKSIEDLLEETAFETIDVPKRHHYEPKEKEDSKEEPMEKEEQENPLENTLESDLFDLIDSMYEKKEED